MRIVKYSAVKLALAAVAGVAMAWFGLEMLGSERGKVQFAGFIFVICGPILSLGTIKTLLGDRVALRIASDNVQIATLWRRRLLGWSEIEGVDFRQVNSYALYGLIRTGNSRVLTFKLKGGLLGTRKLDLSRVFLDIGDEEYYALPDVMAEIGSGRSRPMTPPVQPNGVLARRFGHADVTVDTRGSAFSRTAPASASPPPDIALTPERDLEFDPDAVMARYLAKRNTSEVGQPLLNGEPLGSRPLTGGFGRKGL